RISQPRRAPASDYRCRLTRYTNITGHWTSHSTWIAEDSLFFLGAKTPAEALGRSLGWTRRTRSEYLVHGSRSRFHLIWEKGQRFGEDHPNPPHTGMTAPIGFVL